MSIPFIAAGLAKGGVAAMSSMSTSFMSVAQGAASQAANEGTTGNLSFGNIGMNSRQIHSGVTIQQESGMITNYNRDGSNSISRGTSESDTGYNIQASDRLENMTSTELSKAESLAHMQGVQAQKSEAKGFESILQNHRNIENSKQFSESATAEEREAFSRISSAANDFADTHGIERSKSAEIFGGIGANLGFGVRGSITANDRHVYEEAQRYSEQHQLNNDFNTVRTAARSDHLNLIDSKAQSINEDFRKSAQLSEDQSINLEKVQRYSEQQQFIKSNSAQIDHNYNQEFYNYVKDKYAGGSVEKTAELFNPNNSDRHKILDKGSSDFLESKFHKNEISHDLTRDYAAEAARIKRNGPQNMMQNEAPPHWNDEFKSIDNSELEGSVSKSYDGVQNQINSQTIDQSAKSEVVREQNKGLLGGPDEYDIQKIYEEKKNN